MGGKIKSRVVLLLTIQLFLSCMEDRSHLFTKLPESRTGVSFRNLLKEMDPGFNVMQYPYFYNGGGVAVGDINNDGLPDICFTGNMVKNRLFINKGDFHFEDITESAGIAAKEGWCTGVTMVDINGDGLLDIYISRSGFPDSNYRRNLLFINNGSSDPGGARPGGIGSGGSVTFTEEAAQYGLDDAAYSTQASFFDYDKDGDLDLFVINQSKPQYAQGLGDITGYHSQPAEPLFGNKLYRNDGGHFTEVTAAAGIRSDLLTYSLGLSTADIDQDGWPDIYISNDFSEQDYYYHNNHDGTFSECLREKLDHISQYAMGCDIADYNNDGLPDICVADMLPESNRDIKMHTGADHYERYQTLSEAGFYRQYMKNTLQKNNGDGTFSEIGQLAGISASGWSWSPLFADFDNDGYKDLFISSGYKRDNTNLAFLQYSIEEMARMKEGGQPVRVEDYVSKMEEILLPNSVYRNRGNDHFEKQTREWGLDQRGMSNGAVYADLDNDGDLDLITNNIDDYAGIYRNNTESMPGAHHFLSIRLKGTKENMLGYGAKVFGYGGGRIFYVEQNPVRGFQSSVDPTLHIGLGELTRLDSLRIIWPDDRSQLLVSVAADQFLWLKNADAVRGEVHAAAVAHAGAFLTPETSIPVARHHQDKENDFQRQPLLPHFYSTGGPFLAQGDINGDGLEDLLVDGGKDHPAMLFIQKADHQWSPWSCPALSADSLYATSDALFFDADGDGDLDLYMVGGGYDYPKGSLFLQDRLYLNDGKGHFTKAKDALPDNRASKSCVRVCDIDGDGDPDLYVAGREVPGEYPYSCPGSIYINNGHGKFTDGTDQWAPFLRTAGIVTDAAWVDVNDDHIKDLVIAGEWMPVRVFLNDGHRLREAGGDFTIPGSSGWWNKILITDLNGDGRPDLVLGNNGLNTALKVSPSEPARLYAVDIDGNGSVDPILTSYNSHFSYPFVPMDDLVRQVPALRQKFNDYSQYANAAIEDIIPPEKLAAMSPYKAENFSTCWIENTGKGLKMHALPAEAQYGAVFAIASVDVDGDGNKDLVLAGNQLYNRIGLGRDDANHGCVLLNDGKGNFHYLPASVSGLSLRGQVRSLLALGEDLFVGMTDSSLRAYHLAHVANEHVAK